MRKLLSLVLAFAMILGLFAFPVSADATTYQQVGQELVGLGVLKGVDEKGTLAEMQNLTREQALVVLTRLMGQEDKALATDAQPGFTDVPAAHWYSPYVAYAKLQGWTNGVSETEFGLGQSVTTKQVVTLMMRALGYEADWSKEDVMMKAKELGLLEGVSATSDDAIIRGELFIVMKNTLYTKPMGEKAELIYKLGLAENPVPATLEVVDVKATNLMEIIVEFNQEVDKDTLENAFSSVGLNLSKVEINVEEDGKTVVLSLAQPMKNKKDYKLTISKVKSLSGVQMEKVTKEFKTEDNETPKVEKLEVTGPKTFEIVFSEPVKNTGSVKLKLDGKTGPGTSLKQTGQRRIEVKTSSNLKDGGVYTVLVTGFMDYANYKNIDTELELEYAKVTTAPTVEVVKATQEYVVLKFDRPVKGLERTNFYHTYSAWKPVYSYSSVKSMNETLKQNIKKEDSYREVVVRFLGEVKDFVNKSNNDWHPLQVGEVEFNVLGQVGSRKVVDNWGNQLQDTEIMLTITADKTAPVVETVETSGEKKIEVTFSKEVIVDQNNYEVLKEDGSKFGGSVSVDMPKSGSAKKVTLTLNGPSLVGKTVILNIKNVKDSTINMNKLVGTESFNVTFGDKTFEGVKEVYLQAPKNNVAKLFVVFKEAMDSESATNIKNYKFTSNLTNPEKDQFSIEADTSMYSDSIVQITMDEKVYNEKFKDLLDTPNNKYKAKVVISNGVKDLAGNSFTGFTLTEEIKSQAKPPVVENDNDGNPKVKAVNRNTIEVTFDQPLMTKGQSISSKLFTVKEGMEDRKVDSVEFKGDLNKVVEITLKDALKKTTTDTVVINYDPSLDGADSRIVNELEQELLPGNPLVAAGKVKDGVAPEYAVENNKKDNTTYEWNKAEYTYTVASKEHKVVVEFTEDLDLSRIGTDAFVLVDANGDKHRIREMAYDAATHKVTLKFKVDKDAMARFIQKLKDIKENGEVTYFGNNDTDKLFQDMFTLKVDGTVKDKFGNDLTKDEKKVYFKLTDDIKKLLTTSLDDLNNVMEPAFKAVPADMVKYIKDAKPADFVLELKDELKDGAKLKDGHQVKYHWFKQKNSEAEVEAVAETAYSDNTLTTTLAEAQMFDTDQAGTHKYRLVTTMKNQHGVETSVETVIVVTVKNPTVKAEVVTPITVVKADGKVKGTIKLTLTGAKFAALTKDNFDIKAFSKNPEEANNLNVTALHVEKSGEDKIVTLNFSDSSSDVTATETDHAGRLVVKIVDHNAFAAPQNDAAVSAALQYEGGTADGFSFAYPVPQ